MATSESDVVWMLDVMNRVGTSPVIAGGWGIDALVGRQTREHRDLDVLVPDPAVAQLVDALASAHFVVTTDWLPVRIELSDLVNDRHIDVHPAFDDGRQGWWQHGFDGERFSCPADTLDRGTIAGRSVVCLSAEKQLELHHGYTHRPHDTLDIAVLRQLL